VKRKGWKGRERERWEGEREQGKGRERPIWIFVHEPLSSYYAITPRLGISNDCSINQSINKSIVDALQADVHRGASSRRT